MAKFQDHHVLQQQFTSHPVLTLLSIQGNFDIDAQANRIYLPNEQALAQALDRPPHTGGHLSSYTASQQDLLDAIENSPDFSLASGQPPDAAALQRIRTEVDDFISTMKYAIANGDLWPNTGWQGDPAVYNQANDYFFVNYDDYRQTHAANIAAMRAFENANKGTGALWYGVDDATDVATISAANPKLTAGQLAGLNGVIDHLNIQRPSTGWLAPRAMSFTGEAQATSRIGTVSLRSITRNLDIPYADAFVTGAGRFSEARAQGLSMAEANIEAARAASKEIVMSLLATGAAVALLGSGASAAAIAGATVLTYAVIDSVWDDLAGPLSEFSGALHAADYDRLSAASQAIFEGLGNWISEDVIPFANALAQGVANVPSEAAEFANDPAGYVRDMAQQIWDALSDDLREQFSDSGQFLEENLNWLMDGLEQTLPSQLEGTVAQFMQAAGGSVGQVITELQAISNAVTSPSADVIEDVRIGDNSEIVVTVRDPQSTRGYEIVSRVGADGQYHEARRIYDLRGSNEDVVLPNLGRDALHSALQNLVANLDSASSPLPPVLGGPDSSLSLTVASQYLNQWNQYQWIPMVSDRFGPGAEVRRLPAQFQNPGEIIFEVRDAAGNIVHRDIMFDFNWVENPGDGMNHMHEGTTILLDSSQSGLSRTLNVWDSGYSLTLGDGREFTFDADTQLNIEGSDINLSWGDGDWSFGASLSDTIALWANRDGLDLQFDWTLNGDGLTLNGASLHGASYTEGDAAQWFDSVQGGYNDAQRTSGASSVDSSLQSDFDLISSYQTTDLAPDIAELVTLAQAAEDNRGSLAFLAAGLDEQSSSDQFSPEAMGPHTQLLGSLSAAAARSVDALLRAAYANIAPSRLLAASSAYGSIYQILPNGAWVPEPSSPLVLDLDGRGIELISYNESAATFDVNGDGTRVQIGWVGGNEGLLVLDLDGDGIIDDTGEWFGEDFTASGTAPPAGQKGFEALSTLAVAGATVFSHATALSDASGVNYFERVQVWVDRDQDGRSDAGELFSLSQLGISSIDLNEQMLNEQAAGNMIWSGAGFTYADGSRGDIYDVGFSVVPTQQQIASGPNEVSLSFAELVAAGLPALAAGQAQGAANALASLTPGLDAAIAAIEQYRGGPRNLFWQGYPIQFIRSPDGSRIWSYGPDFNPSSGLQEGPNLVGNNAPQLTIDALQSVANLQSSSRAAAQRIADAADAMSDAQIDALAANITFTAATETAARSSASASANAWSDAVREYVATANIAAAASTQLAAANTALAGLVPTSFSYSNNLANGFTYWSAHDARLAGAAFDGLDAGLLRFASIKVALGEALGAFAQAGAYDNVAIGITGQTVTARGVRGLVIAGQGEQVFVGGSGQDDFWLTTISSSVTIHGFGAGINGDRLQLLCAGATAYVTTNGNGVVVSNGSALNVSLVGVNVAALDLFANITGVETLSFAGVASGGTRSLGGAPVLFDGIVHVRNLIGSNYGDVLIGDYGMNSLTGGAGADTLAGYGGGDLLDGGGGVDAVSYRWSGFGITSDLSLGKDSLGSTLTAIENITGSLHADALMGNGSANHLEGGFGNDRLEGGGGGDTLVGGDGADLFVLRRGQLNGVTISDFRGDGNGGADRLRFFGEWSSVDLTNVGDLWTVNYGDGSETFRLIGVTSLAEADMIFDVDRVVSTAQSVYQLGAGQSTLIYTGTGNFTGIGNSGNNFITSGAGNDLLDGGSGADTLTGGAGNDLYIVDHANDHVVELSGGGLDTVRTTLSHWSLEAEVEELLYLGGGSFTGVGNALANRITGAAGSDTLDGAGGADTLSGAAGDDIYVINDTGDQIIESVDGGIDTVRTSLATYTLGTHLERLAYIGSAAITASGNELDNQLIGGAGNDTLRGLAGNDRLVGAGGTDTLQGGAGDDTYVVDAGDTVTELAGAGNDTVETLLAAYTLSNELENVTYMGSSAFAGTGNASANRLVGGAGADTLDGGAGADWMQGGAGNDTYVVDTAADTVVEAWNGGTDTIRSRSSAWVLDEYLENLTYIGAGTFTGTGNSLANRIEGGAGADILDGRGGGDTLIGGAGHDTYFIDSAQDVVTETGGIANGSDTVITTLNSYTLSFHVENLVYAGSANFSGTGDSVANVMTGGAGADVLEGRGGADEIHGGFGVDTASYLSSQSAVTVNLATGSGTGGDAAGDILEGIENLLGSDSADTLIGNASANRLDGDVGNDTLRGGGGNDVLVGGRGDDTALFDGVFANYEIVRAEELITVRDLQTGDAIELSSIEHLQFSDGTIDGVTRTVQDGDESPLLGFEGVASDDAFMSLTGLGVAYGGGAGRDVFLGGANDDFLYQNPVFDMERYYGGAGNDYAYINFDAVDGELDASLAFYGGAGLDRVNFNYTVAPRLDRIGVDEYLVWQPDGRSVRLSGVEAYSFNGGPIVTLPTSVLIKGAGQSLVGTGFGDYIRAAPGGTLDAGASGDVVELDITTGLQSLQFAGVWSDVTVTTGGVATRILNTERLVLVSGGLELAELHLGGRTIRQNVLGAPPTDCFVLSTGSYTGQMVGGSGNDVLLSMDILHAMNGGLGDDQLYVAGNITAAGSTVIQGGAGEDVLDLSLATFSSAAVFQAFLQNVVGVERFVNSRSVASFSQLPWMTYVDAGAGGNVFGASSDATVLGGLRNDTIYGLGGSLEVVYRRGDGSDLFVNVGHNNATDNDAVRFADDIDPTQLRFSYSGRDLVIQVIGTEGQFRIADWTLGNPTDRVDWIRAGTLEIDAAGVDALVAAWSSIQPYAPGETDLRYGDELYLAPHLVEHWRPIARPAPEFVGAGAASDDIYQIDDLDDIVSEAVDGGFDRVYSTVSHTLDDNVESLTLVGDSNLSGSGNALANWIEGSGGSEQLHGLAGNDVLIGNGGADELAGGTGRDYLHGGAGADIYVFERGDGADAISEMGVVGEHDELRFGVDIDSEQLWFGRTGDDLDIRLAGTEDSLLIRDWYVDAAARVERFQFADGAVLIDSQVEALVSAMAAFAPPAAAQTMTPTYQHHGLSGMIAANYQ